MTEELFGKLDQALTALDDRRSRQARAEAEREEARKASLMRFEEIITSTVRPAMEEVGEYIQAKGHSFEIRERGKDGQADRTIEFVFVGKGYEGFRHPPGSLPFWSLRSSGLGDEVFIHRGTMMGNSGGMTSGDGSLKYDEVSSEEIKKRIVDLIALALERAR